MDARSTVCTRHDPTEKTFNMSPDTNHEKDQQSSSIKVLILVRTNPLRTCREKMCEKVPKTYFSKLSSARRFPELSCRKR